MFYTLVPLILSWPWSLQSINTTEFPDALPIIGLTMRNVSIKKTLVVPEDDHGVEIVLSMELEDGATAKSPGWASLHCLGSPRAQRIQLDRALLGQIPRLRSLRFELL